MAAAEEAGGEGGAEGKAAAKKGGKGAKAGKRFEIKKWNAVAMWSWAICTGASPRARLAAVAAQPLFCFSAAATDPRASLLPPSLRLARPHPLLPPSPLPHI